MWVERSSFYDKVTLSGSPNIVRERKQMMLKSYFLQDRTSSALHRND